MANKIYYSKTTLIGGAATALDYIDGSLLVDGDFAYVTVAGIVYVYKLNASSGAAESSPWIISPDTNAGNKRWILQIPADKGYVKVSDTKAQNTAGGTFTAGAWRTRDINTEDTDTLGLCSIASNQITLAAGTYDCFISVPANAVDMHQARLYNVTDAVVVFIGTSEGSSAAHIFTTRSLILGRFTIAAAKALEVQHYCQSSYATSGFGQAGNWTSEIYTVAEFRRIL
jgi:hypothetical protein